MTEEASEKLTEAFSYHIPQKMEYRTSVSGNFKRRRTCKDIDYLTTLAGYVH